MGGRTHTYMHGTSLGGSHVARAEAHRVPRELSAVSANSAESEGATASVYMEVWHQQRLMRPSSEPSLDVTRHMRLPGSVPADTPNSYPISPLYWHSPTGWDTPRPGAPQCGRRLGRGGEAHRSLRGPRDGGRRRWLRRNDSGLRELRSARYIERRGGRDSGGDARKWHRSF